MRKSILHIIVLLYFSSCVQNPKENQNSKKLLDVYNIRGIGFNNIDIRLNYWINDRISHKPIFFIDGSVDNYCLFLSTIKNKNYVRLNNSQDSGIVFISKTSSNGKIESNYYNYRIKYFKVNSMTHLIKLSIFDFYTIYSVPIFNIVFTKEGKFIGAYESELIDEKEAYFSYIGNIDVSNMKQRYIK